MANLNHDQAFLSEQLLLLHELDLNYSDHTVSHDNVDREMKLLDTVALLLSTGSPGDHFAAAFEKHQGLEVVLAKNGTPTSDDIAAAKELFSHLCNPEIRRAKDLYPFVARRCRASVVKRFQKLRASIIDTGFYDDFCSRLDQCSSARDPLSPSAIKWEFWRNRDSLESYTGESLSVVLRNHLKATARATAVSEVPDLERFMGVYVVASTLAHSRFLEKWVELEDAGYQKVQRFQRCTEKLCRYIDDVHSLVKGAKRLGGPIKHRWVTDESLGIQYGPGCQSRLRQSVFHVRKRDQAGNPHLIHLKIHPLSLCSCMSILAMANSNYNQSLLSERLLLFEKLNYSDHRLSHIHAFQEMKLLDAIALLLTTGLPGDHFAVSFDKRQGVEVVLAKNGTPTPEDLADAKELFASSAIRSKCAQADTENAGFYLGTGFYDNFYSRLDQRASASDPLSPSDIEREFPRSTKSITKGYTGQPLSDVLRDFFDGTVGAAQVVSEELEAKGFLDLHFLTSTIAHCCFLRQWVLVRDEGYQKVLRFQRCAEKLCRYVDDVHSLVRYAKRLGRPIQCHWVTDESLGIQIREEDIRISAETPLEALHRSSLVYSRFELPVLKERKPLIFEPWQRTVQTCLHAELRIILHFGQATDMEDYYRPIGASKPSCLCCLLWMEAYNRQPQGDIFWEARSCRKADATWALSAPACSNVKGPDLRVLDEEVTSKIFQLLVQRDMFDM
ncbi:hypothetical protein Agabi119p4_11569 [Agaricus bisporus var. burnettii]|uniref:Uncharacterized protein n=1 Tax=Agaricus bisporus var. burnettii TaxID=192524 RepID=A0A8H7C1H5_AGABI|nr:hypothetical protein Agabi119p4_11569 [Agaricus bisporus var. burnettii]